jgi:hypothetical protein
LFQLATKGLHLVQAGCQLLIILCALVTGAHRLLHLLQLVAELIQALSDLRFGHDRVSTHAALDPIRVPLHVARQLLLLDFA